MSDKSDLPPVPQAVKLPKKRMRFSVVWVIPLVAALVAVGIAVQRFLGEGPTITIIFQAAGGVEAGKTPVKYKEIKIGQVTAVKLSDDYAKIVVTAKIDKHSEGLIVADTKFWIVQARVTLSGISGIGTLLSGNYIGLEPGKSAHKKREFIGQEVPPVITGGQPGREYSLQSDDLGSLGIGSPVYYRHLNVGQVIGYDLAGNGRSVDIKIFVNAPHDRYITPHTRFWQASGIDVSMGAKGFAVQTQSVLSVLIGGLAFEAPASAPAAEPAPANTVFTLYDNRAAAFAERHSAVQRYSLRFRESLRGLSVGAPVNFLGMPVGEVTDVGLEYHPGTDIRPRVEIALYADRFFAHLTKEALTQAKPMQDQERRAFFQLLIDKGLRAQLQMASLLSGQLCVAFGYFPDAPPAKIDWTQDPPQMPAVPGGLAPFEKKVMNILTKVEKMPLDEISREVQKVLGELRQTLREGNEALKDVRRVVNDVDGQIVPGAKTALGTLDQTLKDADRVLTRVDGEILPGVQTTLEGLKRSMAAAERMLADVDAALVGPDAAAQQELREAMQELARAARAVRELSEYLERNPGALIRGKTEEKP